MVNPVDRSTGKMYGIRRSYLSDARSRHASLVDKIEDLIGVQYGMEMLTNAIAALESDPDGGRHPADVGLMDDFDAWVEFVLLRFEMHTEGQGDYGYQEYAHALSQAEKDQFLQARKLRRSYIQHLSPKWLRQNTFVLDSEDAIDGRRMKIVIESTSRGADGGTASHVDKFELPEGQRVLNPFVVARHLDIHCLDWKVFRGAVDKVIERLREDLVQVQKTVVAEFNNLSIEERRSLLVPLGG